MRAYNLATADHRVDFRRSASATELLPDDMLPCPCAGLHIDEETAKFYLEDAQGDLKRAYQLHRECLSLYILCNKV
jgi:hypothetical protein